MSRSAIQSPHPEGDLHRLPFDGGSALAGWARFRESILTTRSADLAPVPVRYRSAPPTRPTNAADPSHSPALWRLLATNNRELGRSFNLYTSFDVARGHVQRIQERASELELTIVPGPLNASRGWVISLEGSPVISCSRWYHSTSTGTRGLETRETTISIPDNDSSGSRRATE